MFVVVGTAEERVVRDLGVEAGAPLREDLVLLAVVPERIVAQDAAGPVDLRLVDVCDRDVVQDLAGADEEVELAGWVGWSTDSE